MIDVSSIINDPDFNVSFSLTNVAMTRDDDGDSTSTEAPAIPKTGIILPAKLNELQVLPEGERGQAAIAVYCLSELTEGDQKTREPDLIQYLGAWYRVAKSRYYAQCALWYAIAVRIDHA